MAIIVFHLWNCNLSDIIELCFHLRFFLKHFFCICMNFICSMYETCIARASLLVTWKLMQHAHAKKFRQALCKNICAWIFWWCPRSRCSNLLGSRHFPSSPSLIESTTASLHVPVGISTVAYPTMRITSEAPVINYLSLVSPEGHVTVYSHASFHPCPLCILIGLRWFHWHSLASLLMKHLLYHVCSFCSWLCNQYL